ERAHDVAAEPEVGERHAVDLIGLDGLGLETLEHDVVGGCVADPVLGGIEVRRAACRLVGARAVELTTRGAVIAVEAARTAVVTFEAARRTVVAVEGTRGAGRAIRAVVALVGAGGPLIAITARRTVVA